ncbi:MAG TPA: GNAT family N-acetyltransferase [Gaiellaceae bacterium]|jgi:RimJ/RimL family protein N-acetyltransferase|nr:GNAT family N-acetyltransferase [Gaiellaceae bacterium]
MTEPEFHLEPWDEDDLPLLRQLMGDRAMTEHLGGPESPERIAARHDRYVRLAGTGKGRMFVIVETATDAGVGSVGYWERESTEGTVYETGWSVLPGFQGRGAATSATAQAIERARSERRHRYLYAYPSVDNTASNAICRRLGFTLLDVSEYEYPRDSGNLLRCNDWRLDLFA